MRIYKNMGNVNLNAIHVAPSSHVEQAIAELREEIQELSRQHKTLKASEAQAPISKSTKAQAPVEAVTNERQHTEFILSTFKQGRIHV